jgi:hypothetical protein
MCGGDGVRIEFLDNGYLVHAEGQEGKNGERGKPTRQFHATPEHTGQAVTKHLRSRHGGKSRRGRGTTLGQKPKGKKRKAMKEAPSAY